MISKSILVGSALALCVAALPALVAGLLIHLRLAGTTATRHRVTGTAIALLGVLLYFAGKGLEAHYPDLVRMKIMITFPGT